MGKRGPVKTPTPLRVLHGETAPNTEPVPADGRPAPPYVFTADVQAIWDDTVVQLAAMHTLAACDRDLLAVYCEAVSTHRMASRRLAEDGDVIVAGARGEGLVRNPVVSIQRDAATQVRVLAREFGLSPSARSDINLGKKSNAAGPSRLLSQ